MAGIRIRPVTISDVRIVWAFICALETKTFDYDLFAQLLAQNLQSPHHIYLLAMNEQGEAMGLLTCHGQLLLHHMGMVYEIQELFVVPEARSLGTGRKLVAALEEILKGRECTSLEVTSNKKRTDAHRFYISCGFTGSHLKFTKQVH